MEESEEKPKRKRKKDAEGGEKEHKPNWWETHASKEDIAKFLNEVIILRQNVITGKAEFRVPDSDEFEAMGLKPKDRVLPPRIVKFIAEKFCIDVDD